LIGVQLSLVTVSTKIDAPREDVWRMVMDPKRLGEWVTIHRKLVNADGGRPRVGYEMEQQIHLRGVSLDVHWKLVECDPCAKAVWEGRGPARSRARTEYVLRDAGDGTRFDYRNEFRPPLGPIGALVSRALVGGISEREANRTLERLRIQLEKPVVAGN
jgi:carbon monoxide dehydrogenase subunit G